MKKHMLTLILLALPTLAFAHDEGHGPKLTDSGKQGGIVAPVIDAKDVDKGAKAEFIYKAELVRSEDGSVRLYVYDKDMKPMALEAKFGKEASGIVETEKKKEVTKTPFSLRLEEGAFLGKPEKPAIKPFNIDIRLKEAGRELLVAFDNLD
jgi:hypothetical protein